MMKWIKSVVRADPVRVPVLLTLLILLGTGLSVIGKLSQIAPLQQVGFVMMLVSAALLTIVALTLTFSY
jgi:hypothetical protein